MTKEAVRDTLHTEPFRPFSLRLVDGSLVPVPHPDFMLLSQGGRTAVINTDGEHLKIVDIASVTTIELGPATGKAA